MSLTGCSLQVLCCLLAAHSLLNCAAAHPFSGQHAQVWLMANNAPPGAALGSTRSAVALARRCRSCQHIICEG
jgi:hypothetical protein